jgi:methyl-accepting chemotaxis protein
MFNNLKIRTKIGILAAILMVFIFFIAGVGFNDITKANKDMTAMYNDRLIAIELLNDNRAHERAIEADIYYIMLHTDNPQEQKIRLQNIENRVNYFNENFEKYKKTKLDQFEIDTIKILEDNLAKYRDGRDAVLAFAMSGKYEEAKKSYGEIEKIAEDFQQNLVDLSEYNVKIAEEVNIQNDIEYANTIENFTIILIISLLFSIGVTLYISRAISVPITLAVRKMIEVANYDISVDISSAFLNRKDEIGELARAIQKVEENLRSLIKNIENTSEQVAASAEELTATAQQSTIAADEVAKTIDEIAKGALDQAQSTTQGSEKLRILGNLIEEEKKHMDVLNESSSIVNDLVGQGLYILDKLGSKIKENSNAMENVYESIEKTNENSNKISEASNLIASIADQTNLLALNAAIEAARAGEHGRGFAVVAEEIRKLAEQSTESTKIIDDMVKALQHDSQKAVEIIEGVAVIIKEQTENMNFTENKFNEMNQAIKNSRKAVEIIGEAGVQMEQKKNEVLETIQILSAVAQENAAGTEEVSASMEEQSVSIEEIANSSEDLSQLSQELQGLIGKFTI